jgi:tripartite-type tricarboxylate transporter receptor subunit TctC
MAAGGISMKSVLACAAILAAATVHAQQFPTKPVRIVMGVAAGGQADTLTRGISQELSKRWGQPVLIENRPGSSGIVATESVVKSAPDGHTLFTTDSVQFITNQLMRTLPYDPVKDLTPVVLVARTSSVLAVSLKSGIGSLDELVQRGRAKPGALNYGSFGVGSSLHLGAAALGSMTGFTATHIPYKGGPEMVQALASGDIDFALIGTSTVINFARAGKVRLLAGAGATRSRALPDLPAIGETVKGFDAQSWYGWLVPSATPRAVVDRIAADAGQVITQPEWMEKYIFGLGLEPLYLPAGPFAERLAADREKYATLIRSLGIKLE